MDGYKTVMDYIMEQMDRYDTGNIQFEDDVMHRIGALRDRMNAEILRIIDIHGDIPTVLKMEQLVSKIEDVSKKYHREIARVLSSAALEYTEHSYKQFGDLVDVGMEVERKASNVKELQGKRKSQFGEDTIEYIRDHALERVQWISTSQVDRVRSKLGEMILQGNVGKAAVREEIEKILKSTKSKAEEIAQTELSLAYNTGALKRMDEYNGINPGRPMRKYWYGFKYSEVTCTFCRPKIGTIYSVDDNTYHLPAHPRCRCVWLPMLDGWDKPISTLFTRRANMLSRVYSPSDIYARINLRLGIRYAEHMPIDMATKYLEGERTATIQKAIQGARSHAIDDMKLSFNIAAADAKMAMGIEYNQQMQFWKDYVASNLVDNNRDNLSRAYEAVRGVMMLPWSAEQLTGWTKLLDIIFKYK
jgi:SPP1 gp7 family putative phage head morphogenesis protein